MARVSEIIMIHAWMSMVCIKSIIKFQVFFGCIVPTAEARTQKTYHWWTIPQCMDGEIKQSLRDCKRNSRLGQGNFVLLSLCWFFENSIQHIAAALPLARSSPHTPAHWQPHPLPPLPPPRRVSALHKPNAARWEAPTQPTVPSEFPTIQPDHPSEFIPHRDGGGIGTDSAGLRWARGRPQAQH